MSRAYTGAIEHHCPNATLVIDRFHVVKALNQAVDEVLKDEWHALDTGRRKAIKGQGVCKIRGDAYGRQFDFCQYRRCLPQKPVHLRQRLLLRLPRRLIYAGSHDGSCWLERRLYRYVGQAWFFTVAHKSTPAIGNRCAADLSTDCE